MTQNEFINKYNSSPLTREEIAYAASLVDDNKMLSIVAERFIEALDSLNKELAKVGFIYGR